MVGDFGWEHEGTKSGVDTVKYIRGWGFLWFIIQLKGEETMGVSTDESLSNAKQHNVSKYWMLP